MAKQQITMNMEQMKARVYDLSMQLAQVQARAQEKIAPEQAEATRLQQELASLNASIAKGAAHGS